jgi:Uma2 family endonuclease
MTEGLFMEMRAGQFADEAAIGIHSSGIRMSARQYRGLSPDQFDEHYRYELVHGVLVVTPPPLPDERDPNDELGHLLRTYRDSPLAKTFDATLWEQELLTLPDTIRRADRAIWVGLGRLPDTDVDVPAILVEFVSAGKRNWLRDYDEKRDEYLAVGVQEYWVFNRFLRQMSVFRKGKRAKVIKEGQSYETPLLPGFALPIAALLGLTDRWAEQRRKK